MQRHERERNPMKNKTLLFVSVSAGLLALPAMAEVASKAYVDRIVGASAVQSDWNQTTNTEPDYIWNKPTLGTAAAAATGDFVPAAQVPASGTTAGQYLGSTATAGTAAWTTAGNIAANLGSTTAANPLAGDIGITGTLGYGNGGTNATTQAAAFANTTAYSGTFATNTTWTISSGQKLTISGVMDVPTPTLP